jgi:hypothetical protein
VVTVGETVWLPEIATGNIPEVDEFNWQEIALVLDHDKAVEFPIVIDDFDAESLAVGGATAL